MKLLAFVVMGLLFVMQGCVPADEQVKEPEEPEETMEVDLYFGDPEAIQEAEPGEYGYVTPVVREIAHTEEVLHATLEELIEGPKENEKAGCEECEEGAFCDKCLEQRVTSSVPADLNILGISIEDETATLDFCENMFKGEDRVAGTLGGSIFVQSILWTATQFPAVEEVQVLVEGEFFDDGHMVWDEPKSPDTRDPEEAVGEWVERSRKMQLGQAWEVEDKLYLLATYGERPTGGYSVEISEVTDDHNEFEDKLVVTVKFEEPEEDEPVTTANTYPYDLKKTEPVDMPVKFLAEGDKDFLPMLDGIEYLQPVVAEEEDIKLFSPEPGTKVEEEIVITGIEQVFEGNVQCRLLDLDGKELDSDRGAGHGHHWGYFTMGVEVPEEVEDDSVFIEVYSECPKDGSKVNVIEMELILN